MKPVPGPDSTGQLAGDATHNLNNLLGAILLYSELLLADTDAKDPRHADLLVIQKACVDATEITRHLATALCPACAKARDP